MADLSQTAANVEAKANCKVSLVQGGEAITQGMPVRKLASDGKWYQCDADVEAEALAEGIAVTPCGGDTESFVVAKPSGSASSPAQIDLGATLTVGETYVVSTNKGAIAPIGDLASGDYVTHLGVASAADTLDFVINASGTAKP